MGLHPDLAAVKRNLPKVARSMGFEARVTSGYRSYKKQAWLYDRYQRGLQEYPVAPPGTSDHEKGLALDVVSTDTTKLVSLLASVGLSWAGPTDPVHFYFASPQIAAQAQKIKIPKTVGQVAEIFYKPIPLKILDFIQAPVQNIKDNVSLAFDVVSWLI